MEREKLRELRLSKNMTQKELASTLDISTVYVRKIEKGTATPGLLTMIKYETFFHVDMKILFNDIFFDNNDKKCIKELIV